MSKDNEAKGLKKQPQKGQKGLPAHLNPEVQWKPGQSGNPIGRPLGARSKFSEQACADALADWTAHGGDVLARVRATDPSTYLRVLFSIIPRNVQIDIEQRNGPMDRHEMRLMRRLVDMIRACGAAAAVDVDTVFGWLEQELRARTATVVGGKDK